MLDRQDRSRFEVLHDSTHILDDARQNGVKRITTINLKQRKITFDGNLAASPQKNGIFYFFFSDAVPLSAPAVVLTTQVNYKDL